MIINVGDLLTVLRFKDEATPLATRALQSLQSTAVQAARAVSSSLTPAVNATKAAAAAAVPVVNNLANAIGGGGTGGGGGGGAGGGAGGGGLGGSANFTSYRLTLLGRGMRELSMLSAPVTAGIVGTAAAAITLGTNFESVTSKLVSLANVQKEELPNVKRQLLEIAQVTGKMPQEIAEAMYAASSTTEDTAVALQLVNSAARLSAGGLGEVNVVTRALTTVINSYGKENITAAHAADVLVRAIRDGGAEAKELAPELANVVPFAAKLGIGLEQVAANFATVTKLGVPAGEAITQLTSVFASMARETKRGSEALSTIGLTYGDLKKMVSDEGIGLQKTLQFLSDKFGLVDGRMFDVVGRLEALKNILNVTGAQSNIYAQEVANMNDAQGESAKVFDTAAETTEMAWNRIKSSLAATAIQLANDLLPVVKSFLGIIQDVGIPVLKGFVDFFNALPRPIQFVAFGLIGLAAAFSPIIGGFGLLTMAAGNLYRAFGLFTPAKMADLLVFLRTAAWPATMAFGGLALAIGAVWIAWKIGNSEGVKNYIAEWALSADNLTAKLYRALAGVQQLTPEQAKAAVAASNAAEKQAAFNKENEELAGKLKGMKNPMEEYVKSLGGIGPASEQAALGSLKVVPPDLKAKLAALRAEVAGLTQEQKENILAGAEAGLNNAQIALQVGKSKEAVAMFRKEVTESEKANAKHNKELTKFLESVTYLNNGSSLPGMVVTLNGYAQAVNDVGVALENLGAGLEEDGTIRIRTRDEIAAMQKAAEEAAITIDTQFAPSIQDSGAAAGVYARKAKEADEASKSWKSNLNELVGALRRLKQVSGDNAFSGFIEGLAEVLGSFNLTVKATDTMREGWTQLTGESKQTVAGLINIAQGAISAAAAFMEATASGNKFQATMGGIMSGAQMGSMFGPWGTAIGAIAGGLVGFFRAGSNARKEMEKLRQEGAKLNEEFLKNHKGITDLTAAAKLFGIELMDVTKITDKWQLEAQKELLAALDKEIQKLNKDLGEMIDEADEIGIGLPQAIQDSLQQLVDMGVITDDLAARLSGMLGDGEVDWKKMKEAADRYGISEAQLGQSYNQARLNTTAQQMIDDFEILKRGGTDVGTILSGMKDQINKLVNESIKLGTTVPENMRPWIQNLIDTGQLLDENGQAITDINKIRFGATLESQFDKLIRKLDDFLDRLLDIPRLFHDAQRAADDFDFEMPTVPGDGGGGGGGGTDSGVSFAPGSDSAAFYSGPSIRSAVTAGSGSQKYEVALQVDDKVLTDFVIDNVGGRLSIRGGR